ncbi:MAG: type II secretion system F family protein, partial [Proteobacteria bacterium]|nr:type II secretion system F family protein [Pseudomonadota bacterium]
MALFEYTALDTSGKEQKGTIQADSEKIARNKLRQDGFIPIDIIAITKQLKLSDKKIKRIDKKIPLSELTLFTRELCALLSAGLEIERSVAAVAEQIEHKTFKEIVEAVHTRILEGYS